MFELCDIFSVSIYAYAVMDNHYHIVLYLDPIPPQNWRAEEIAEKWLLAYPGQYSNPKFAKQRELKKQAIIADKEKLEKYRKRLGSLSWFMGRLNEPLAKQSNQEEDCTGRFWEGRYSSQALLDEAAVFSCMAYIDLNPIRAGIAEKVEESQYTAINKRVEQLKEVDPIDVQKELDASMTAITHHIKSKQLLISLKDYIELVEYAAKSIKYPSKSAIPAHVKSTLSSLNLQPNHWLKQVESFSEHYCHVVGPIEKMRERAAQLKKRCLKGASAAKLLYENPN